MDEVRLLLLDTFQNRAVSQDWLSRSELSRYTKVFSGLRTPESPKTATKPPLGLVMVNNRL